MRMTDIFFNIFVAPLLTIYDHLFQMLNAWTGTPGWTILCFSIILNIALLPLYYQMETAGRRSTQLRETMMHEIRRIKKNYKGRERYFYIKTTYRIFNYNPFYSVFTSTEIYLQVFIFVTVLLYLGHLNELSGVSFFIIRDLSRPDGLLFGINILPVLMTIANLISAVFYTKDKSKRRQAFAMAALFLVLLYDSPSALVLYWTSNNIFSLLKNGVEFKIIPRLRLLLPKISAEARGMSGNIVF